MKKFLAFGFLVTILVVASAIAENSPGSTITDMNSGESIQGKRSHSSHPGDAGTPGASLTPLSKTPVPSALQTARPEGNIHKEIIETGRGGNGMRNPTSVTGTMSQTR